ncbi:hypothetical protein [Francisella sp. TX07-6608]|nr:hypothetical protein [Francisella sp. TX07-6608]OIN82932.1 hypothetical protein KX00_2037 [Francisella sp. TX07-6608]
MLKKKQIDDKLIRKINSQILQNVLAIGLDKFKKVQKDAPKN